MPPIPGSVHLVSRNVSGLRGFGRLSRVRIDESEAAGRGSEAKATQSKDIPDLQRGRIP
jgi:hypothetical protein